GRPRRYNPLNGDKGVRQRTVRFLPLALTVLAILGSLPVRSEQQYDLEFARAGEVGLTLDAAIPEGPGPFPTAILVHGGGFVRGDKQSFIKPLFEPLQKAGFAWFSINYRLAPAHRYPACLEDVETAIRWVNAHAREYRVDRARIALIGESAGGYLVSAAGARLRATARVTTVVPFYAPHDLEFQVRHRNDLGEAMRSLFGLTELNDAAWQTLRGASVGQFLKKGMPPYLLIHGTRDEQVPYEQSVRFAEQMEALGNSCELYTVPEGGHGMGGWERNHPEYREFLLRWLRKTMKVP
ncbi:MAG: alpha/beta hydrolase, partial [Armatimonadetes bacterium]|nr:alpha/beta hydrolase [Armatimonadota bacterium]